MKNKTIDLYQRIPNRAQIAHKLGVTRNYISMLILGKRKNPEMLEKIKKIIHKSLKVD
ncbi:MAG: helix-turn-helix transcriptional regulator [Bacteroidota bacterium]|nr:helix-turn-helix transcriptional regulator [Bacteroidota bacterium]